MFHLLPGWDDGGNPWGGLHDCRQHSACVKVPCPKAKKSAFSQQSLFAMTSTPMVTVSTIISAHEIGSKCIEAVQRIFPDFQPEIEPGSEEFPNCREAIEISQEGVATDLFLQLLCEQRILDTALDAMSINLGTTPTADSTQCTTSFLISRQAALMAKVAFVLESERSVGGVIKVSMESPDLPLWLQEATWHPGRREVPRSVGDDLSMRADGTVTEWFDKKGRATIHPDD